MKLFTFIFALLISSQALAHVDHALGEGQVHYAYHVMFYALLALVVFKGYGWLKGKRQQKNKD